MAQPLMEEAAGGPPPAGDEPVRDETPRLLARLREVWLANDPAIPAEMVTGDTLEELEASLAAARELAGRVREQVRRESAMAVPAGAPGRLPAAPATPLEKIRAGLVRKP